MDASADRIKAIFNQALEIEPATERARFLDRECSGNSQLRARVEGLLGAYFSAGSFLENASPGAFAPTVESPHRDQPGEMVGHYKLLYQLGEGGMGMVFLAEQQEPVRRQVALKIIKPGLDTHQVIARFEAERQALAMMDHPNIAKVLDAGTTPTGRPYFVMELVKGIPITKYCDQEHLPPKERLSLFIPVCQAVQHAHQKGVIHRDLKPSNVLVALYDGRPVPKVIDFGVAKATSQKLTDHTMYTEVGSIVGTLEYMAPEQAELNNLDVDTRADIYSLGVMLYELLTGSPPFSSQQLRNAAFAEVLRMLREVDPPKPSTKLSASSDLPAIAAARRLEPKRLRKLVHGELDWIVMKCLEKERARRYETASELAADISGFLNNEPLLAGPPSAAYRLRKFVRKNRRAVMAVLLVMLALIGGIVGTTAGMWRAVNAEQRAEKKAEQEAVAKQDAIRARREEASARQKESKALAQEKVARQNEQIALQNERQQRLLTEQALEAKQQAFLRSEGLRLAAEASIARARDPGLALLLSIEGLKRHRSQLTFGSVYDSLAACRELRTLQGHTGAVNFARFNPDGQLIVTAGVPDAHNFDNDAAKVVTARVWDAKTWQQRAVWRGYNLPITDLDWSADGRYVAVALSGNVTATFADDQSPSRQVFTDRTVYVWDPQTGQDVIHLTRHDDRVVSVSFSPDSSKLVSSSWDNTARIWDIATGKLLHTLSHERAMFSARFLPDGKRVLTVSANTNIGRPSDEQWLPRDENGQLLPADPGVPNRPLQSLVTGGDSSGSYSFLGESKFARIWNADTGEEAVAFTRKLWLNDLVTARHASAVAIRPDGRHVAIGFEDGSVAVWDTNTGGDELFLLADHGNAAVSALAYSHDGQQLVTATADKLRLWDANAGSERKALQGHAGAVRKIVFSHDGQSILTCSEDQTARLWTLQTGESRAIFRGHTSAVTDAQFSADQQQILTAGDTTARLWTANQPLELAQLIAGHTQPLTALRFSPDGQQLLTASEDETAKLWQVSSGKLIRTFGEGRELGKIDAAAFSHAGDQFITASRVVSAKRFGVLINSSPVHLWGTHTGRERLALMGHESSAGYLLFSPDDSQILTISDGSQLYRSKGVFESQVSHHDSTSAGLVRLWNATTGQVIAQLPVAGGVFSYGTLAQYRPNSKEVLVVLINSTAMSTFDTQSGQLKLTLQSNDMSWSYANYTSDGQFIVALGYLAGQPAITIWNADSGKLEHTLAGVDPSAHSFCASHDSTRLAALCGRNIQLWDLQTRQPIGMLRGHEDRMTCGSFSPDGRWLLTGSDDRTAVLWNLETQSLQSVYRGHAGGVRMVHFHPSSQQVATGSTDAVARLWPLELMPGIQARTPRDFSAAEVERYGLGASE